MKQVNPRRSAGRRAAWAALPQEERERRIAALVARNKSYRKYSLDEHYFDAIDTPEKAYWLGFIAGVGGTQPDGTLRVNLAPIDIGQLENLAAALGSDSPIRHGSTRLNGKTFKRVILSVYSLQLTRALGEHGIVARKTWCMEPWAGLADLMPHYWRGLVDADGTLMAVNPFSVRLVGTESVVTAFGDWIRSIYPSAKAEPRYKHSILWEVGVTGRVGSQAIAGALYGGCVTSLARKAERATEILAALPPVGPARTDRSPEARARRSQIHKGQVPSEANREAHRTPEFRERARQRQTGRKDSDETRRRKSEAQLRRHRALRQDPGDT